MIMNIITSQLAKKLQKDNKLLKFNIVDPTRFTQTHQLLTSNNIDEIHIIDATRNIHNKPGAIISVHNHINRTGINILIDKQKLLSINFIDITTPYIYKKDSIITNCCGETLNNNYEYPSHYMCNITILAHAINIKKIHGFLYNTI